MNSVILIGRSVQRGERTQIIEHVWERVIPTACQETHAYASIKRRATKSVVDDRPIPKNKQKESATTLAHSRIGIGVKSRRKIIHYGNVDLRCGRVNNVKYDVQVG